MRRVVIAGGVLVAAAVLLLVPFHPEAPLLALLDRVTPNTPSARAVDWFVIETGGNVLLFTLIGGAAFVITRSAGGAVVAGVLLSAGAELVQLVIPHRVASFTDFVTNALGTLVGVALAAWVARPLGRSRAGANGQV